jgi:putative ABC transport system ATP-binding protein
MSAILNVEHLEKYYGNRGNMTKAVDDLGFAVESGEFVGIMGASGSGKTTLLNCISTIDLPTAGHIILDGLDLTRVKSNRLSKFRREKLGFIFQDFNLLDTLTAYENIALALTIIGTPVGEIDVRVLEVAKELDIEEILPKYPYQISGGQKQRVACARAIVTKPALILADEPTGALDSKSARMLLESLETLNQALKATILMVTHDAFTASYCRRILFLRDGRIFDEIVRGQDSRKQFFSRIIEVQTLLGGDNGNVL